MPLPQHSFCVPVTKIVELSENDNQQPANYFVLSQNVHSKQVYGQELFPTTRKFDNFNIPLSPVSDAYESELFTVLVSVKSMKTKPVE